MSEVSLKNYFAGLAMQAELITAGACRDAADSLVVAAKRAGRTVEQHIAVNAYSMASTMLEQSSCVGEGVTHIVTDGGQALACSENVRLEHERLRGMLEKASALIRKQEASLVEKDAEIERLLVLLGSKLDPAEEGGEAR